MPAGTSHRVAILGLAALLLAGEAQAGVMVKLVNAGRKMTLEFEGNKLRMEEEGNPRIIVFDGDTRRYIEIRSAERTFATATPEDVVAAGRAADAQLRQRLSSPDPEGVKAWIDQRNRVRRRMEAMKGTRFEATGGQAMVASYMCDGFDEIVDGETVAWGCYVQWSRNTFRKEDFSAITRFAEFLDSGLGQVEAAEGIDLRDGPLGRLARSPGFPLFRIELVDRGKSAVPLKVTEISRQTIAAHRFQPPAGYTSLPQPPSLALPVKVALPADTPTPR